MCAAISGAKLAIMSDDEEEDSNGKGGAPASVHHSSTRSSSGKHYCRACGYQMDLYRERMISLMEENKTLAMDNKMLKAEVWAMRSSHYTYHDRP